MSQSITDQASNLPLRQDDPFSMLFLLKALFVAVILLGILYAILRLYAKRNGASDSHHSGAALECVSGIRLSSKTKVYLLKVEGGTALVTEHVNGATLTILSETTQPTSAV